MTDIQCELTRTHTHTHTWADLVCQWFTMSHLVNVLLRVEVIPFMQGPAQLMSGNK